MGDACREVENRRVKNRNQMKSVWAQKSVLSVKEILLLLVIVMFIILSMITKMYTIFYKLCSGFICEIESTVFKHCYI